MSDEKEVAGQVDSGKKEVDKLISTGNLPKALQAALALPIPKDDKLKVSASSTHRPSSPPPALSLLH